MASFSKPLSNNPDSLYSKLYSGAAEINPRDLIDDLIEQVPVKMSDSFGIKISAAKETITVGGLFNKKEIAGCVFRNTVRQDYASVLVGIDKIAATLSVDVVPYGAVSRAMQRMNRAEAELDRNPFSVKGGLGKLFADENAVQEESLYYSCLVQSIQDCVESWGER